MRHFFVDPAAIQGKDILLTGSNFNHIKNVLRMRTGDVVSVSNGIDNREYRCHIESFGENEVHCRLDFIKEADVELPVRVTLFQGLPKGDKMDFIVEKSVELGVSEIVPVSCSRSVLRPDPGKAKNRVERWRKKAEAAAKQSRRSILPEVHDICDFGQALEMG
ncbi:MAG: 16S rRNA (uracil(1498)-N(3))-methyltransferase, partial [Lachnospiraceae bacterium]|nr:16S rRNA (uracil(1498)-N(3))-methyltransferase [Lachnospiraceae bacterium]